MVTIECRVISHIGNGEFGSVAKAYWKHKSGEVVEVAVKSVPLLEYSNNSEDRVRLLQEAVMMGQFRHPNVVQLHGIATAGTSVSYIGDTYAAVRVCLLSSLTHHMVQWLGPLFVIASNRCVFDESSGKRPRFSHM